MGKSVLTNYSKSQVEQMTKKALNIISSNSNLLQTEKEDDEERQKNEIFAAKYDINEKKRLDILKNHLTPSNISDIQIDERDDNKRKGNPMLIYLIEPLLEYNNEKIKVQAYLKIELIQITGNTKICLLISLHEPEHEMERKYDRLL